MCERRSHEPLGSAAPVQQFRRRPAEKCEEIRIPVGMSEMDSKSPTILENLFYLHGHERMVQGHAYLIEIHAPGRHWLCHAIHPFCELTAE